MSGLPTATAPVVRPLRWWDLPAVLDLERALFAPDDWSPETWWGELAQAAIGARCCLGVLEGDRLVGYGGLATQGEAAYVQTIGVAPAAQGRGLGRVLLRALLTAAEDAGATSVGLEVRADNAVAQSLYARAGFVPRGVRRGYYQPSGADALVMTLGDPAGGLAALS